MLTDELIRKARCGEIEVELTDVLHGYEQVWAMCGGGILPSVNERLACDGLTLFGTASGVWVLAPLGD